MPSADKPTKLPSRKNPRANFHDYNGGDYFVTICAHNMRHYFGEIIGEEMNLSEIGVFATQSLEEITTHHPFAQLAQYVVMPNHIHLVISIADGDGHDDRKPRKRSALGVVIGSFKRAVSAYAKRRGIPFGWQASYHDHIIRGCNDANNIYEYVANNVVRWALDRYNPESPSPDATPS